MKIRSIYLLASALLLILICPFGFDAANASENVKLQLKWFHQFQFAGYYAAKEQGYYADEGLDVEIIERAAGINVLDNVVFGEADYGIGDSGILADYANGVPIKALAAIFQHNPLVFISKRSSGIISPYEMNGKRIMFDSSGSDDAPFRVLLADAGLGDGQFRYVPHSFDNQDLMQ
ncbi:MAG: ABC transporter substrate-binding protein, partial [Gammaproteobacteria bacterium]